MSLLTTLLAVAVTPKDTIEAMTSCDIDDRVFCSIFLVFFSIFLVFFFSILRRALMTASDPLRDVFVLIIELHLPGLGPDPLRKNLKQDDMTFWYPQWLALCI